MGTLEGEKQGDNSNNVLLDDFQVFCNETIFQIFHADFNWFLY